jgi:hypothetical protein
LEILFAASLPEFHSSSLDRDRGQEAKGADLARHEGDFEASSDSPLSLGELLNLLASNGRGDDGSREHAIACYLSGDDGWREAVKLLDGTFARQSDTVKGA